MTRLLVAALVAVALLGQAPPVTPPPTLTTEQKLQFQVIVQRIEIARLKAEAAQREFEAAQRDAGTLVEKLKVPGYNLDLNTLAYVKLPEKPK